MVNAWVLKCCKDQYLPVRFERDQTRGATETTDPMDGCERNDIAFGEEIA